jgi:arylsulfatase
MEEAKKNFALPLDDRTATELLNIERPTEEIAKDAYTYYPHTSQVSEAVAVNVRGKSFKIVANVDITDANASGVIFAHGSRFGGHSLFIKDHKLYYVYNFLHSTICIYCANKKEKYTAGWRSPKRKQANTMSRLEQQNCISTKKKLRQGL